MSIEEMVWSKSRDPGLDPCAKQSKEGPTLLPGESPSSWQMHEAWCGQDPPWIICTFSVSLTLHFFIPPLHSVAWLWQKELFLPTPWSNSLRCGLKRDLLGRLCKAPSEDS